MNRRHPLSYRMFISFIITQILLQVRVSANNYNTSYKELKPSIIATQKINQISRHLQLSVQGCHESIAFKSVILHSDNNIDY